MKNEILQLIRVLRGGLGLLLALGSVRILVGVERVGHESSIYVVGLTLGLCFFLEALDRFLD